MHPRDRVAAIAATKPEQALALARAIGDPWFRCQALSLAAVHVEDRRTRERAIDDAFAAANDLSEPNRLVTVSSWPVKALALTGDASRVSTEATRLLQTASMESSPVRRADALRSLLGGVGAAAARDVAVRVAKDFAAACLTPLQSGKRNRKGESLLEECLPAIAQIDPNLAASLLTQLTPSRSAQAAAAIEAARNVPLRRLLSWPHFESG